jgi:hypothetical protein
VTEAGCVGTGLRVKRKGEQISVRGEFGVFDEGQLQLDWIDPSDLTLRSFDLGAVSPLNVVSLNEMVSIPDGASRARLVVQTPNGQCVLAEAEIL